MSKPSYENYFSLKILKEPEVDRRGAIILSQVDYIVEKSPWVIKKFYVIEIRSWRGLNESKYAHIKLVEDLSLWEQTLKLFPEAICLDIGTADFVDTDSFRPLGLNKDYSGIQVSHWSDFKRPELFTRAAGLLPKRKFLKLGHFVDGGSPLELEVRNKNIYLAKELGAKIDVPYSYVLNNKGFPNTKEIMNQYINSAQIGILTTAVEGINRFKMECLSTNIPVIVPADTSYPTKKHINEETGGFFNPTPKDLARKIEDVIENIEKYNPRDYVKKITGKSISLQKLKGALKEACKIYGEEY